MGFLVYFFPNNCLFNVAVLKCNNLNVIKLSIKIFQTGASLHESHLTWGLEEFSSTGHMTGNTYPVCKKTRNWSNCKHTFK